MRRILAATVGTLVVLAGLASCSGDDEPNADPSPSASPTSTSKPRPAKPAPRPKVGACYDLTYDEAVAPTTEEDPVPCDKEHTAQTVFVGELDTVVDGHLVAVDSDRVQQQVAADCPKRLSSFLGGSEESLRLSMLTSVWFSPTVEESDAGQNWYRCEVVALAGDNTLTSLDLPMKGVLGTDRGRDTFGMCGTARPGTKDFERVACARPHSWRAVSTVEVEPGRNGAWPGEEAARRAGEEPCQDAARAKADDALKYTWGYEWPTRKQWKGGRHHGFCWAPAE